MPGPDPVIGAYLRRDDWIFTFQKPRKIPDNSSLTPVRNSFESLNELLACSDAIGGLNHRRRITPPACQSEARERLYGQTPTRRDRTNSRVVLTRSPVTRNTGDRTVVCAKTWVHRPWRSRVAHRRRLKTTASRHGALRRDIHQPLQAHETVAAGDGGISSCSDNTAGSCRDCRSGTAKR